MTMGAALARDDMGAPLARDDNGSSARSGCPTSHPPCNRRPQVGPVDAEGTGANGALKMCAERRMMLLYPGHRVANGSRDRASGAFGRGPGPPVSSTQPDRPGKLPHEHDALCIRLRGAWHVSARRRRLDVLID